jgi:hypothetical protein
VTSNQDQPLLEEEKAARNADETVQAAEPSGVPEEKAAPKKRAASKAASKSKPASTRKKPTAKRKPRVKTAEPKVVEPVPVMTMAEAGEKLGEAKEEFKSAIAEPVMGVLGKYSEMARDGLGGLISGFLGNKKRG